MAIKPLHETGGYELVIDENEHDHTHGKVTVDITSIINSCVLADILKRYLIEEFWKHGIQLGIAIEHYPNVLRVDYKIYGKYTTFQHAFEAAFNLYKKRVVERVDSEPVQTELIASSRWQAEQSAQQT